MLQLMYFNAFFSFDLKVEGICTSMNLIHFTFLPVTDVENNILPSSLLAVGWCKTFTIG